MLPIHSHKETQQYCCTISSSDCLGVVERTLGCYSDDGALWGRSWSYCDDDDGEIGHVRVLWHKSIGNKSLFALLLIEKYA